jgi:hypothetical protein
METSRSRRDDNRSLAGSVDRDVYHLHKIIDVPVTRYQIDPPKSFTLFFKTDPALIIYDDSKEYESFQVNGIIV